MTASDDIAKQKADLRWALLDKRDALAPEARAEMNRIISAKLLALPEYQQATTVLAYMNIGSEFDTSDFIRHILASGKKLVLPKVNRSSKTLDIFQVQHLAEDLVPGVWGIAEPDPLKCKTMAMRDIDFVLVPGLAFDARGQRVGYGGGYYDKLLAQRNPPAHLIAAAYSLQMVAAVPCLPHDLCVAKTITETSI